ncbi:ATPase, T2SS/T4P/T4SS family [Botrimarina hoheduenensis]|uniref:ATPase, T2SS/T4P/T4SS family n=1 Tax=Botrimarina hoheduenensis TaxID=2528000 RepID=UPI0011B4146B|nr:ATPase, T2SS/T4P/T4SS family [Botrimarina hoheduenensis]
MLATIAWIATIGTPASAQLADVLEANNIRNEEIEGGGRRASGGAAEPAADADLAAAAEPTADAAAAEGDAAPAPVVGVDKWNDEHSILRNKSLSIAWPKLLLVVLALLAWARTGDWVNRDAQYYELGYGLWNPVAAFPFAIAMGLLLVIPSFLVSYLLLTLAWLVPLFVYAAKHNRSVEPHEKVFTSDWFRFQVAEAGKSVGLNLGAEKQAGYLKGPPVEIQARGGEDRINQANLLTARQSPGYVLVKELVSEMSDDRAIRTMLDYGQEAVSIRRLIDGVWHNSEPRDRESGDVLLAVMKQLANLSTKERRKKQEGVFGAKYNGYKYDCRVVSQGVKTGERVVVSLRGGATKDFSTFEQLGMREKLREQMLEATLSDSGVIVVSAMPEGGLTALTDVTLLETDRLMRDFVAIESTDDPQREIENIEPHQFDPAKGENPAKLIPSLSRKYPNVYVVRDVVDEESAKLLMNEVVEHNRLLITTAHAKEAPEALLRLLQKKLPHRELARTALASLNTRLIRLLCDECKVEFEPSAELLAKLKIPKAKVEKLYRAPKAEEIEKPCKTCQGIGYVGRTGLFELLIVDDQVRQVLLKQPKLDLMRKAARLAGMRTLKEEGALLIARGKTSVEELSRILTT